jgi:hypothetical protein
MAEVIGTIGFCAAAIGLALSVAGLQSRLISRRWIGFVLSKSRYTNDEERQDFDGWTSRVSRKVTQVGVCLIVSGLVVVLASYAAHSVVE